VNIHARASRTTLEKINAQATIKLLIEAERRASQL